LCFNIISFIFYIYLLALLKPILQIYNIAKQYQRILSIIYVNNLELLNMNVKERIKDFIKYRGISVRKFEDTIGVSHSYVSNIRVSIQPDKLSSISIHYPELNIDWLLTGEGDMLKEPRQEAVLIENPNIIMVPLVGQYAYAGYLCGFNDKEYMETLPTIPVIADHNLKGDYLNFEVRGDSMEDGSLDSLVEGDILVCRIVKPEYWKYKLHINKWDFVIVHKTEGVLIKRIVEHDPDTGYIRLHSLNPLYNDFELNLKDVAQLFNVVQVLRSRKR